MIEKKKRREKMSKRTVKLRPWHKIDLEERAGLVMIKEQKQDALR